MPCSVLLVIDSFEPSGLLSQARTLAKRLPALGYEPYFAVLRDRGVFAAELRRVTSVESLGRRHAADPVAAWKLRRLIDRLGPTVVHAWGATAASYAAAGGAPLVAMIGRGEQDAAAWRQLMKKLTRARSSCIVAPSAAVASESGWLQANIISPGVEIDDEAISREEARAALVEELNLPADARVIAVVGRLLPRKAVKELIWVADLLRVVRDETRLVIIGEGVERPVLERFARLASTVEHIRFLGPRTDVVNLVRGAEVLWHAGDEASPPLAVLEAMAADVPVVADDTIGCRQVITDNENGLLVPDRHRTARVRATRRLFQDRELGQRLAAAARETVEREFTAERLASDYAAIYEQVCSAPNDPATVQLCGGTSRE